MKLEITPRAQKVQYSSRLEEGDYIPYFYIKDGERKLDMQVKASYHNLLIFVNESLSAAEIDATLKVSRGYYTYVIAERPVAISHERLFHDPHVYRLFMPSDARYGVFLCDRNLKLIKASTGNDFAALLAGVPPQSTLSVRDIPPPLLIIPDVVSADLAARLIAYHDENGDKAAVVTGSYKSRSHIHPHKELERELDNKLCKSMLPEIKKVFYSDISHRETYKVCCYDSTVKGTFGRHRDTIFPHLHRRYALTLTLNDDFEGGGVVFPEYNEHVVKVPKYSAIIFPGSLYHQVTEIGNGKRYVIVSFLFTEAEASIKDDTERYRFLVQRDICDMQINRLAPESHGDETP
ncbi:MAG: hypothetical protein V4751_14440 [Pseudomonadota bacterium]